MNYSPENINTTEESRYTSIVSRFLRVDDITWGDPKQGYIIRFRGQLYNEDAAAAYDQLAQLLRPLNITPLFRMDGERHAVLLMQGVLDPKPSKVWINLVLFVLTVFCVLLAGAINTYTGSPDQSGIAVLWDLLAHIGTGLPFAASLMAILLAHEFGHYLAARYHKTRVTLPYYLPFPLSPLGTMGAFIQIKEPPKNRRILLDIGIAGPLAGLVVAIPILIYGISLSKVETLPLALAPNQGLSLEGNSLLYLFLKLIVKGQLLPAPATYNGMNPLLYWLRFIFTATPFPWGGTDIMIHPIAWAGWAGLLVTSLNLIPAGQLDGGHLAYVLFGRRTARAVPVILLGLLLLGMVWSGWWLWAFLIFFLGRVYLEPLDQITTLDFKRKALAVLGIIIFFIVFIPVPMVEMIGSIK